MWFADFVAKGEKEQQKEVTETCSGESQSSTDTECLYIEQRPRREPGPGECLMPPAFPCPGCHRKTEQHLDTIHQRCCKNGISRSTWSAVNHFHIPGSAIWIGPEPHQLSANSSASQYRTVAGLARPGHQGQPVPALSGADFVILISSDFCTQQSVRYLHKFGVPWAPVPARPPGLCRIWAYRGERRAGPGPGHGARHRLTAARPPGEQLLTHIWKTAKGLDHDIPKWANGRTAASRGAPDLSVAV